MAQDNNPAPAAVAPTPAAAAGAASSAGIVNQRQYINLLSFLHFRLNPIVSSNCPLVVDPPSQQPNGHQRHAPQPSVDG